jgi:hypothetical protein
MSEARTELSEELTSAHVSTTFDCKLSPVPFKFTFAGRLLPKAVTSVRELTIEQDNRGILTPRRRNRVMGVLAMVSGLVTSSIGLSDTPSMTAKTKTIAAGAVYGTLAGAIIALGVMGFVPAVGHPMTFTRLPTDFQWAIFFSWPTGPLAGALAGWFLVLRGRQVSHFGRLVIETTLGGALLAAATQLLLPGSWDLPRSDIALIAVPTSAILAALGAVMLRPLYWKRLD